MPKADNKVEANVPSLYVLNAAALTKVHAVEQLAVDLASYETDIAVITETHLKTKHTDSAMSVPGYTLHRRDSVGEVVALQCMSGPPLLRQSGHSQLKTGLTNSYGYVSGA